MKKRVSTNSKEPNLSSVDPYALLGIGAALALYDREEDIAHFIAGAVATALRVKLGAVALLNASDCNLRMFGQFNEAPLRNSVAKEIENILSDALSNETLGDIEVNEKILPNSSAIGLRRLLAIPLRTLDSDFGVVLAGTSSEEPYSPAQTASLEALSAQTSIALHRVQLNKDRVSKEVALRESEERYRGIFAAVNDGILIIDPSERYIVDTNQKAAEILRYSQKELRGMPIEKIHPKEMEQLKEIFKEVLLGKPVQSDEFSCLRKDNHRLPAEISFSLVQLNGKDHLMAMVRDISERKGAEQALRESEERFRTLYNHTPVMMHSIDPEGKLVSVNDYWLEALGYELEEVVGEKSIYVGSVRDGDRGRVRLGDTGARDRPGSDSRDGHVDATPDRVGPARPAGHVGLPHSDAPATSRPDGWQGVPDGRRGGVVRPADAAGARQGPPI